MAGRAPRNPRQFYGTGESADSIESYQPSNYQAAGSYQPNPTPGYPSRGNVPNTFHQDPSAYHGYGGNPRQMGGGPQPVVNPDVARQTQVGGTPGVDPAVWVDEPSRRHLLGENRGASVYMDPNATPSPRTTFMKNRTKSLTNMNKVPDSLDEAFRLLNQGVDAEKEGRYPVAMKAFLDGAEMLTRVGDDEGDPHVRNLIHQKALDVMGWCEAIANWMDNGKQGPPPRRLGRTVTTDLIGRIRGKAAAPALGSDSEEFRVMYYTACSTKKVDKFSEDGYLLQCMRRGRRPKLMVVITMYNEDENELSLTLRKVANNVTNIQQQELPGYKDDEAWQNVLVCVVSDGRTKANPGTMKWLSDAGCFDEKAMTINSVATDVQMHLFEYSLRMMAHKVKRDGEEVVVEERGEVYPPLQLVFALKEHNGGKLNSHEWYFNAFAEQVMPKYTVLLDVGTMPTKTSFYLLLGAMESNPRIGGVCGEIAVDRPIPNLCNWVIAAQHYEYKVSNILDKSMESVFGFISVLPGAFSAYRYEAIRGPPLQAYFKSLTTSMKELGPFQGNMYLAEDRILCFEIVARRGCNWTLHYVKNAIARTDVPKDLVALIGQRRRWLNGSFFAILYTIRYWGRILSESNHSVLRKTSFMVQYGFNVITVVLSWFLVSNFYLAIYFNVISGLLNDNWGKYLPDTKNIPSNVKSFISIAFQFLYGTFFLVQILTGLGNKPKHLGWVYTVSAIFYGVVMGIAFIVALLIFAGGEFTMFTVFFAVAILGVYFLSALAHCELHHICMAFFQYFALLPTTINVLMVYSFCNLHDLSWGTKGLESSGGHGPPKDEKKGNYEDVLAAQKAAEERARQAAKEKEEVEKQFSGFRTFLLFAWLISNFLFTAVVQIALNDDPTSYLTVLYVIVGLFNIWRFIGSCMYLVTYAADTIFRFMCLKGRLRNEERSRQEAAAQAARAQAAQGAPPMGYSAMNTPGGHPGVQVPMRPPGPPQGAAAQNGGRPSNRAPPPRGHTYV